MARRLSLDTSFLIDLQREQRRGLVEGPARTFVRQNTDADFFVSVIALGEFAQGFDDSEQAPPTVVRRIAELLPVDEATCLIYGRVGRTLRLQGNMMGANDLWIGATSLRHELPVVTANVDDFSRIDGLEVISYR